LKIVYIITRSEVIGGASVHLLDLAQGVQAAGHDVILMVGGDGIFVSLAKDRGLHVISLRHLIRRINIFQDLRGFFEIRNALQNLKPDIVHLHSSKAGILGRLAARRFSIPVVFTAHGWAFTEGVSVTRRFLYRAIEQRLAHYASKIITVSDYDRRLALSSNIGDSQLVVTIHNGIPDSVTTASKCLSGGVINIIMVARFDAQKNHRILLDALARIKHHLWNLNLVGDGPLLFGLKQYALDIGLEGRVNFLGACNDVALKLSCADIFCLMSNWEGLPLTILEAMRAGLPVIASDVGGVAEAVDEGETGFLIARDDVDSLVSAITKLLTSADLRYEMGQRGLKKFENEFAFDSMLNKTISVYSEIIKRGE
jgi:glycosyltransferase involved in cell wall biosynthesis